MTEDKKDENLTTKKTTQEAEKEDTPDSFQKFAVQQLSTNKTLFCISLAFSIFAYCHDFSKVTGFWNGIKTVLTTLPSNIDIKHNFLFITEIFLTAFAITRFLKFINIIDLALRTPFVSDLIFWMSHRDRMMTEMIEEINALLSIQKNGNQYVGFSSVKFFLEFTGNTVPQETLDEYCANFMDEPRNKGLCFDPHIRAIYILRRLFYFFGDDSFSDGLKRAPFIKTQKIVPHSIRRYSTIQLKGLFFEEKILHFCSKLFRNKLDFNEKTPIFLKRLLGFSIFISTTVLLLFFYFFLCR